MFKVNHGLASEVLKTMFAINNSAQLRSKSHFCVEKSILYTLEMNSIKY